MPNPNIPPTLTQRTHQALQPTTTFNHQLDRILHEFQLLEAIACDLANDPHGNQPFHTYMQTTGLTQLRDQLADIAQRIAQTLNITAP